MYYLMVEGTGFEPVKALPADLQSAPFGRLGNPSIKLWSRREDLNPQPADYKSAALPVELHRLASEHLLSYHEIIRLSTPILIRFVFFKTPF